MQRLNTYQDMLNLRNPDAFDMYTFNDHAGYGAIEVAQNMLLDFKEAAGNWKEQWAICEALALLFNTDSLDPMVGIDDGDLFGETMIILELMFLSMLAELEKQGQLAHVRNLGWVMGMVTREADAMRSDGFIEAPEGMKKKKKKKAYAGEHFVPYLLAYGVKHNITMYGPSNIADIIAEAEEEAEEQNVELPAAAQNPWGWATGFKAYERKNKVTAYGAGSRSKAAIGGDSLDITTYSPAERKAQSFNKKDPLTKDMIKALKDGMCLSIG
ncbi:uncharacterized protein BO95DRAFT_374144 [Aspergillus brunneoviolaceus CBS 621.78]|uniref:Uncharacterized protein n=1 Tax=Aspergillus brunneoviolaceus CBS 621.78 TaxID=1450534 RepID=A0ACD1FVN9_9EURO|nr:hypothetical protein BO95DRAFT_374144 [Aspergillus brunneoviolaceus CBS 621.78]RAH41046.1 hypothetical protein BO95DRAFT_374144 [Aspergillus brunneoviolaceus CBS 621.78]